YRLATLYNNMSFLCMDLGHYEEAETSLNDALYILKALDDSEIDVAVTYSNLANVYLAMNRLEEAKVTVKKALDLFIAESGDTDVHYAGAVSTLGAIYFREENWEKAAALMETALKLNARDYGEENQSYAILSSNLADCLEKMGRQAEAEEYRRKAAAIMERIGL
ncbi:MAG: tetratricopeptide repeat protein, partial [Anaerovoracaceae bacterium]